MKIKKQTIIRTILLIVALVNVILEMKEHSIIPFDDELAEEIVSYGFLVATTISSWWHNNSFTKEAIIADEYLEELKESNNNDI